jgi:5-(carboxyamino)imidazole ribonucleotide synthase
MRDRIGIVGGGQLGRMLTLAAKPLGFHVTVLDPGVDCPAAQVGAAQLAARSDVVTWEIEHIDAATLQALQEDGHPVEPSPATLAMIQDKLEQKRFLARHGLPVAEHAGFDAVGDDESVEGRVRAVVERLGRDIIVKTRTGGYDGRGNFRFDRFTERLAEGALDLDDLYAERIVPFTQELSVVAARGSHGDLAVYPTAETVHVDNICHTVTTPARISAGQEAAAREVAHETLQLLGGAGVFAIEMFAVEGGVVINEIAPRVHNSGHHTIEANVTSQFEQHIRAVSGMPLGSTESRAPAAAMINVLGRRDEPLTLEGLERVLAMPDTHAHFYGKSCQPKRKVGHITVLGDSVEDALRRAEQARGELAI